MIGCIVVGGLIVFGAMKLWHHRHHPSRWCGGGHWGRDVHFEPGDRNDDADFGPRMGRRGRRGSAFVLRYLSDRLQASPAQERVMADAIEEFRTEMEGLRGEGRQSRQDVATALRKPSFDEVLFGELFARHDERMEKVRKAFVGLVAKLHDALDESQRERLAAVVEKGPPFFRRGFAW